MSKKDKKKAAERGTYALYMTAGLILGIGLGAILNSLLITTILGIVTGAGTAYFFSHQKRTNRH